MRRVTSWTSSAHRSSVVRARYCAISEYLDSSDEKKKFERMDFQSITVPGPRYPILGFDDFVVGGDTTGVERDSDR